ncbi:hypothetical protein LguiA_027226 [Lonicera macranthoides]
MTNTKPKPNQRATSLYSPKLSIYLIATCVTLFILFQIKSLQTPTQPPCTLLHPITTNQAPPSPLSLSAAEKLRQSVTFLPLKDLRYSSTAQQGHTWFMSSTYDTHVPGEVQYQKFPSHASRGKILCLRGNDTHDGAWNSYAFAYTESLPINTTLVKGLTFVSNNHYNYDNIWHGLSATVPFVGWHLRDGGCAVPSRWILYHWGEVRTKMSLWLRSLMEATFDGPIEIERWDLNGEGGYCFEEAVVMRHNEGGMSRERRMEVYDLMRCKARVHCKVRTNEERGLGGRIGLTLFMRSGPRSFRNETAVIEIFERECVKVGGCRLTVAHSNNLTFCEQVKLMSSTDILVSPHGAQLTNMFLMDRNSSVMEFFPKGWLKLAGVGQYVYHWIASWSGMNHRGAWRDPTGDPCPYPEDDRWCMSVYKSGKIGHNETYFAEWARSVLNEVKLRKIDEQATTKGTTDSSTSSACSCS